jgi:hypothetical protein
LEASPWSSWFRQKPATLSPAYLLTGNGQQGLD